MADGGAPMAWDRIAAQAKERWLAAPSKTLKPRASLDRTAHSFQHTRESSAGVLSLRRIQGSN